MTGDRPAELSARYWDERRAAAVPGDAVYWLAVLELRRRVNRKLTGDPDKLFIQRFLEELRPAWPIPRAFSLGCGAGELERGVAGLGAVAEIVGSDPGPGSVAAARRLAAEAGLGERARFTVATAEEWLATERETGRSYDLAFCHGVLHHIQNLEEVADGIAALLTGGSPGLLYVDEYVGPNRDEWRESTLGFANGLFDLVPEECRRTPAVWPPIAMEDPTEMIRSSDIESVLAARFVIERRLPYHGNVLFPLVNAIDAEHRAARDPGVARLGGRSRRLARRPPATDAAVLDLRLPAAVSTHRSRGRCQHAGRAFGAPGRARRAPPGREGPLAAPARAPPASERAPPRAAAAVRQVGLRGRAAVAELIRGRGCHRPDRGRLARLAPPMAYDEILQVARQAGEAGAAVLREQFRRGRLEVREKAHNDFVTSADHASEEAVLGVVRRAFPDHAVLSEEAGRLAGAGEHVWVVDPLDGTNNFLQGLPVYCVSVACCHRGRPVAGVVVEPESGRVWSAARGEGARCGEERLRVSSREGLSGAFLATGYPFRAHGALDAYLAAFREVFLQARAIRRLGAAALDLAQTAAGVFDGFFELRLSPWDLAAGVLLVEEAGGMVSDLDGGDAYFEGGNVVAGGPRVWRELREVVARHADEEKIARLDGLEASVVP